MGFERMSDDLNVIQNLEGSDDNNYGCSEAEMRAKFDEAANKIKKKFNKFLDELEAQAAAGSIGYDGALGRTVKEALDKLISAGIGNLPPDDAITPQKLADNAVTTPKIADNAITNDKLSESINSRLDYLYNNLTKLLILIGAQNEIEGSEELILFGLDGLLEDTYNAIPENISCYLDNYGNATDNKTFTHTLMDATNIFNTNDVYNVTDDLTIHNTKLTEIKNAVLKLTTNSRLVQNGSYETVEVFPAYLGDNYYAVATFGWIDYDDDKPHSKLFVVKYDESTKEIAILHELAISSHDYNNNYFQVINGIAYWSTVRFGSDDDLYYLRKLTKDGISSSGLFENYLYAGFANGIGLYVDKDGSTEESICRTEFSGTLRRLYNASDCKLYALSGYWAALKIGDTYSLYNVASGIAKAITKAEYDSYSDVMRSSQDLDTFYVGGYRYTIDDIGVITKHEFIQNYVKGKYTQKISANEELVYSGEKNGSVYKIVKRPNRDSICIELFNTSTLYEAIQKENPAANPDHFAFNPDTNTLLFGIDFGRSPNAMVRVCELTKGTIKLVNAITNTLKGPGKISREQKCIVPANEIKQVFLKAITDGYTFNSLNLVVYLDRALASGDELKVEVINKSGSTFTKTVLPVLSSSSDKVKYYNYTYSTATSDVEIVTTIKAGATELKATQILGGVDNAI